MGQITIKVHNVIHDTEEFSAGDVEDRMLNAALDDRIDDVRISKGRGNSPLYITMSEDVDTMSIDSAKKIARQLLRAFNWEVDGIDVDRSVRDDNIMIQK